MASPKANWFVNELPDELDTDPFDAPVEEVGTPIDMRSEQSLFTRLIELVHVEGLLDEAGVRCAIRARPLSVCSACPVSQAATAGDGLPALCRAGAEQERVVTLMAVAQERDAVHTPTR